jgi:hypothetical protein
VKRMAAWGWFALAFAGQAAALALSDAGPVVAYTHLRFAPSEPLDLLAAAVLALQALCVVRALSARRTEVSAWVRKALPGWRSAAFVAALALVAAKISRPAERSALEFAAATAIHLVALGNFGILALSLARPQLEACERLLERCLGPRGAGTPQPGGLDRFAWTLAALAVVSAAALNVAVYERSPHVPDELVYVLHARYLAAGELWLSPPPVPAAFDLDLMLLDQGKWFCPVPPGWPAVLALGVLAGVPWLVNPLLGGVSVLAAYLLLREVFDRRTARVGVLLVAASPWFTFLDMSFMTHSLTLACSLLGALGVARSRRTGSLAWAFVAGVATGVIALIRPLDGLLVAAALGLWSIGLGGERLRKAAIGTLVVVTGAVGALTLPYNRALTGSARSFPIQHYVDVVYGAGKNDLGFGPEKGLGWSGLDPWPGHTPAEALVTSQFNAYALDSELFGWACGSLVFALLALLAGRWSRIERALGAFAFAVVASSWLYWFNGGPDFGARYWYLAFLPLVVWTLGGMRRATSWCEHPARVELFVAAAVTAASLSWLPWRALDKYRAYRGVRPSVVAAAPIESLENALVLVAGRRHPEFAQAALLNRFEDPRSTVSFAWLRDAATVDALIEAYPQRALYCLRGSELLGPLDVDAARHLAREVPEESK